MMEQVMTSGVEARYWFDQAARQGHVSAQYGLGKLLLSDDPEVRDRQHNSSGKFHPWLSSGGQADGRVHG